MDEGVHGFGSVFYATNPAGGSVRVAVQDETGHPMPGFELESCEEIFGDDVASVVPWNDSKELSAVVGRPVRLRVEMRDADLFAFRFRG